MVFTFSYSTIQSLVTRASAYLPIGTTKVTNLHIDGASFVVSGRRLVVHNTSFANRIASSFSWLTSSLESNKQRLRNRRADIVTEAANDFFPESVATVYIDYLNEWLKDPDATAVQLLERTHANALRPELETIRLNLEWRLEKGAAWPEADDVTYQGRDEYTRLNWTPKREQLLRSVYQETQNLLSSEDISLKDYMRLADGYLLSLKDYDNSRLPSVTGTLWQGQYEWIKREFPFFHVTANLGTRDFNSALVFGSAYVQLLHPSQRMAYDRTAYDDAFWFGNHDEVAVLEAHKTGQEISRGLDAYLRNTVSNLHFYRLFLKQQGKQDTTTQALLDTWLFRLAREERPTPSRLGSPWLSFIRNSSYQIEQHVINAQHPFQYRPSIGTTPTPKQVYDSLELFSTIQLSAGHPVPWNLLPGVMKLRSWWNWHRLPRSDDEVRASSRDRTLDLAASTLPDQTTLYSFSYRTDGWSIYPPVFFTSKPEGDIDTPYLHVATAGELRRAGFDLRSTESTTKVVAVPPQEQVFSRLPGEVIPVAGWTLDKSRTPVLSGGAYYDGTSLSPDTAWIDVEQKIHRGPVR